MNLQTISNTKTNQAISPVTNTKIYVRPVPRPSVQGRHTFTNKAGKKLGYTKAKGASTHFQIPSNPRTGKLNLPFDEKLKNPWFAEKEEDISPVLNTQWVNNGVWRKKIISKQEYFEIKHGREPGFYNYDAPTERNNYGRGTVNGKHLSYLQNLTRVFVDGENLLDLSNPDDEIWYEYIMGGSSLFAKSQREIIDKPFAKFYISHVDEAETEKAHKNETALKAQAILWKLFTEHPSEIWTWVAFKLRITKSTLTTDAIKNLLTDYITEKHEALVKRQLALIETVEALSTPKGKAELQNVYFLRQLVNKRILSDKLDRYIWTSQKGSNLEKIGNSEKEALLFLENPENEDFVEMLNTELRSRM